MSDERFETLLAELSNELDPSEREELAARLALSVDPIDPGPAVRERVMDEIDRREAQRRVAARRSWRSVAALAAATAAGALVSWAMLDANSAATPAAPAGEPAGARVVELEELLAEQDEELAGLEGELGDARDAVSVLLAERLERLDLVPAANLDASGRVYWDWEVYSCYFVADGLPAPPADRTYVLWLTTDAGEVLRAGSFTSRAGQRASFFAMLPKDLGTVVEAVVTDEPSPPGEEPSGAVLLAGSGARG